MTPQYKSLKVNKLNEYNKGDNNALLHMAAKAQRSKPTHAATSAMPPKNVQIFASILYIYCIFENEYNTKNASLQGV